MALISRDWEPERRSTGWKGVLGPEAERQLREIAEANRWVVKEVDLRMRMALIKAPDPASGQGSDYLRLKLAFVSPHKPRATRGTSTKVPRAATGWGTAKEQAEADYVPPRYDYLFVRLEDRETETAEPTVQAWAIPIGALAQAGFIPLDERWAPCRIRLKGDK